MRKHVWASLIVLATVLGVGCRDGSPGDPGTGDAGGAGGKADGSAGASGAGGGGAGGSDTALPPPPSGGSGGFGSGGVSGSGGGDAGADVDVAINPDVAETSPDVGDAADLGGSGNGVACSLNSQCGSGWCVDGVCCNQACGNDCQSCSLAGMVGTCSFLPNGTDPDDDCDAESAASCGLDGMCNGYGACRLHSVNVVCAAASCVNSSTEQPARLCDGAGTCRPATTQACAAGSFCSGGGCTVKRGNGVACEGANECTSNFCVDGVCCAAACDGACQACDRAGQEGTCSPAPAGTDPDDDCTMEPVAACGLDGTCNGGGACRRYVAGTVCAAATCAADTASTARTCDGTGTCQATTTRLCAPYTCGASDCRAACSDDTHCQSGLFCSSDMTCQPKQATGSVCTGNSQCQSGSCADGICCATACTGTCEACNIAGSVGTCTAVPDGQDPAVECPAEAATTCGRVGGCDGARACKRHPVGTTCAAQSCTADVVTATRTCDGAGTCIAGTTTACSPYACGGISCRTVCAADSDCAASNVCATGTCMPTSGLVLHWKFDETSGTTAADSSGNSHVGTHIGTTGTPTPSTSVAPLAFTNERSASFTTASRHATRITAMPAALKPTNNFSVSAWYRATAIDTSGGEVLSAGNQFNLRVKATQIEFSKRVNNSAGTGGTYVACNATVTTHLDGNWHHIVGVSTPAGIKTYVDGVELCSLTSAVAMRDVRYDQSPDFYAGRHPSSEAYDFGGLIDDLRVYNRALSAADVSWLFLGKN